MPNIALLSMTYYCINLNRQMLSRKYQYNHITTLTFIDISYSTYVFVGKRFHIGFGLFFKNKKLNTNNESDILNMLRLK